MSLETSYSVDLYNPTPELYLPYHNFNKLSFSMELSSYNSKFSSPLSHIREVETLSSPVKVKSDIAHKYSFSFNPLATK